MRLRRPDWLTLLAAGVIAYVSAAFVHEALGHGLACMATGQRLLLVSSAHCECDALTESLADYRIRKAAGTLMNLLVGGVALAALRYLPRRGAWQYAAWLTAAVNLFQGGGYLMADPIGGFGDWTAFARGLEPAWAVRVSLILVGTALSMVALIQLRVALYSMGGGRTRELARWYCWVPFVGVGAGLMTLAAARNPGGPALMFSSFLANVPGTAFLAWLPAWFRPASIESAPSWDGRRSLPVVAVGTALAAFAIIVLGPGIRFTR